MADSRFFHPSPPLSLADITEATGAVAYGVNTDFTRRFEDVAPLESADHKHIGFIDNPKYIESFSASKAGACFTRKKNIERAPEGMILLITEEPYTAFAKTVQLFHPAPKLEPFISPHAIIASSAQIGEGSRIEAGAWIGENVTIGVRCHIGANVVIHHGVEIGNDCSIGACSTLSHSILGNHVIIHRGAHIGQDGFGFAPSAQGILKVPQVGRVLIGDHVDIGSGTCIDRGSHQDTIIGAHSKIDNLVQIGHNCRIGSYVLIAGQVGIAGSTRVEDGAMLGGQVGLAGHLTIGKRARIAAQSGIQADVPAGGIYGGSPAVPIRDWQRQTIALAQLVRRNKDKKNDD